VNAGGLHIVGTERHDSRRIDNQLRGRAGRQGDPGSSRFYLSLEDDLMKRFASERVTGLMERLGLDDETYIESGIVGKTIESAQSRVEGFNFDIRKRVVEFDDVINKQRETIYAERDKVLRNEDLTETVRAFLDEEIDVLADTHLSGGSVGEWGIDAFVEAIRRMGFTPDDVPDDELHDFRTREDAAEHLKDLASHKLDTREEEIGPEWTLIERFVLLRTIDSLWVEHLTELDDMRRGIGLRGYAQQDPLNEFRKEAYRLYEELSGFIRHQVASTIFRVTLTRAPAPTQPPAGVFPMAGPGQAAPSGAAGAGAGAGATRAVTAGGDVPGRAALATRPAGQAPSGGGILRGAGAASLAGAAAPGQQARPGHTPTGQKIGRNDPCWCGSGAKYKKCHGR
jgi:preprotein translocase subunit SecA